ncbi:hypothetical protein Leryth_022238 [Lithospermum erythrorhizon]|nr:hypothetical protein Leryth_022238 [Lithospermum erythrorhizon]
MNPSAAHSWINFLAVTQSSLICYNSTKHNDGQRQSTTLLLRYASPSKSLEVLLNIIMMIYLSGNSRLAKSSHATDGNNLVAVNAVFSIGLS